MLGFVLVLAAGFPTQAAQVKTPPASAGSAEASKVDASTPEKALRAFLVAMATKDETTLRAVTLPTDDFAWLLKGQAVPAEHLDEFKRMMAEQPIKTLKVGDEFTLPGNRKFKVPASDIADDKAVLVPEGAPTPTRVRKVDGKWKVDATPIISGRKAAEAARMKKTAKPKS